MEGRARSMATARAAAAIVAWVGARASEASTYRGLAILGGVAAAWWEPEKASAAAAAAAACVGIVEMFKKG